MTQSAASQHVRALEGALGTVLLERAGGEVLPTQAGEALAGFARDILRLATDAERHVAALREGRAGRLALGASGSAVYLAPALIAGFRAAHAGIEVGLEVRARAALLAAVAQGTLDAALVAGPVGPVASAAAANGDSPELESHVLCPDRIVLAVCPTSPLLPL